jgi:hypothetical protein
VARLGKRRVRGGGLAVLTLLSLASLGIPTAEAAGSAEQKPSAAHLLKPSISSASPVQRALGRVSLKPIPAELLVPVAHFPAEMVAPSATDWLTFPTELAMPGEGFASWRQASVDPKVVAGPADRRDPPLPRGAGDHDTLAKVPLPPRRPEQLASIGQQDSTGQPSDELPMPAAENDPAAQPEFAARPIPSGRRISAEQAPAQIEALILRHAERFEVPAGLVRRVAWVESKFDPKQRNGPYWGLMQISVATARSLGFRGEPRELLDADTNMTYAVAYLANAYKVAGRNERRAQALYARGYYYEAKRKGMLGKLIKTASAVD